MKTPVNETLVWTYYRSVLPHYDPQRSSTFWFMNHIKRIATEEMYFALSLRTSSSDSRLIFLPIITILPLLLLFYAWAGISRWPRKVRVTTTRRSAVSRRRDDATGRRGGYGFSHSHKRESFWENYRSLERTRRVSAGIMGIFPNSSSIFHGIWELWSCERRSYIVSPWDPMPKYYLLANWDDGLVEHLINFRDLHNHLVTKLKRMPNHSSWF